jgi:alpha-ketoglutarate-dependent taurine dioxygenase
LIRMTPVADDLLTAARSVVTTFAHTPSESVPVTNAANLSRGEAATIARRYARHGFAICEHAGAVDSGTTLALAKSLCLGQAFVPPLYSMGGRKPPAVSRISASANSGTPDADHPSFGRTGGQELHCDGTLQDIGYVKASLLLCAMPAAEGGDTTLFNTSAAVAELAEADLAAARALAFPGTLIRRANINGCTDMNAGPVVAVQNGNLICRYCVTETDSWAVPDGVVEADLRRGIDFLAEACRPGSRNFLQLRLNSGQAIVFDNTRISHGRTMYTDSPGSPRCMYRSLHLRHPRVRVPATDVLGDKAKATAA